MLEPDKIRNKRFGTAKNGLNPVDVTEFLADCADEIERLRAQNAENEEKIRKLVEKINEYRDDEEAIKSAMIHAQKESNKLINDAKAKARDLIDSAKTEQVRLQETNSEEIERIKKEHHANVDALLKQLKEETSAEIESIKAELTAEQIELARAKAETTYFKSTLLDLYTQQIKLITEVPEMSDEELDEYETQYGEYYDDEEYYEDDEEYYDEEQAALDEEAEKQKHYDEVINTASFTPVINLPTNTSELRFGRNSADEKR
ncbi:cell division initiation protein [Ruminococcus sp. YE71]|uniref:DivIVA domain-containing protein n=1 Tax=unclassified Ruminococcus TaxID=2608920 RepID=UPI000891B674|nr:MULTISPECIES: DivIVA domain-containing protein [unclassified Ruminococcus]SDA13639.1 cell division initiation protein [Ruminococcus sp. YE78]SFW19423.1 cell division initiation protein [Ruminococcus sp. YE71]